MKDLDDKKLFSCNREEERWSKYKCQALCITMAVIWAEQNVTISPDQFNFNYSTFPATFVCFCAAWKKRIKIRETKLREDKQMCHFLTSVTCAISDERHICMYNVEPRHVSITYELPCFFPTQDNPRQDIKWSAENRTVQMKGRINNAERIQNLLWG